MNSDHNCWECRFFSPISGGRGQCRRHPPRSLGGRLAEFPEIRNEDWCGEWLPGEPVDSEDFFRNEEIETVVSPLRVSCAACGANLPSLHAGHVCPRKTRGESS